MKRLSIVFTLVASSLMLSNTYAGLPKGTKSVKGTKSLAAGCAPATASTELDINNVRALIQTGGDMWWNLIGQPQYEVPQNSGNTALFAGSLWLGGRDVSGQLKVAAIQFRSSGIDYWTGPLSTVTGEVDASTCSEYDKHYVTTRDEVAQFVAWYEDPDAYPSFQIPNSILEWPAHGRPFDPYNEDYYLAPFFDRNGDGNYVVEDGDYPAYDLSGESDCKEKIVNIYGDQNLWWVFNDKGNIHTETGSEAIGMEIRAQAFSFATNDEVNNMTFYNYELVNRSTFTLTETYFGQWVDPDLGNAQDDYVGCDVERGLGYCYNGDNNDEDNGGATGYGIQPPAIGVDFFQGPYQDNDGLDNPLTTDFQTATNELGIPYQGIGIGYGDSIPDNERFGMRKFLYYNNSGGATGNPNNGVEYYNYLRGFWKDGSRMIYGGTGHTNSPQADPNTEADYMFPGDTDPAGWGTSGLPQRKWTEETEGNTAADRRFMQSAGPFVLQPGALNNITFGVVWARAKSGGPGEAGSVASLRLADDKTQALFDNCFKILSGPDAPELEIQELDGELLVYITNKPISNNFNESYAEVDPFIIAPTIEFDTSGAIIKTWTEKERQEYATYLFQGYEVYQVFDAAVSASDLDDADKARLIFQCDVKDDVSRIINYPIDEDLGLTVPELMIEGENIGITKAFKVTNDLFASGDNKLINHRSYYFIAIAYAYNNFEAYDSKNPSDEAQSRAYLASRKAASGGIKTVSGIPHKSIIESGGTVLNAEFGEEVEVTRIEGTGNGGYFLDLLDSERDKATKAPFKILNPTYKAGFSPIKVKIIDPLNVVGGNYTVQFVDTNDQRDLKDAYYIIYGDSIQDTLVHSKFIEIGTENLLLDLGISISLEQAIVPGTAGTSNNGLISSKMDFANDNEWLSGVMDVDGFTADNWILSGKSASEDDPLTGAFEPNFDDWDWYFNSGAEVNIRLDDEQVYENVLEGTWAPYRLSADHSYGPVPTWKSERSDAQSNDRSELFFTKDTPFELESNQLNFLQSVDIVFTSDTSKWTRSPVLEMSDTLSLDDVKRGRLRSSPSVDKRGVSAELGAAASTDINDPSFIAPTGMGWFPGYAVNIETGERLNIAFGEASYLANENGRDMLWNPTDKLFEGPFDDIRLGGSHYIIVYRNNDVEDGRYEKETLYEDPENRMPMYDYGQFIYDNLSANTFRGLRNVVRAGMWAGLPLLTQGAKLNSVEEGLIPDEAIVRIRVDAPYRPYSGEEGKSFGDKLEIGTRYLVNRGDVIHDTVSYTRGESFIAWTTSFTPAGQDKEYNLIATVNGGIPLYQFNLDGLAPEFGNASAADDALQLINVVPNPYYAYSQYESDKLDNRIKITNLPPKCDINIYTVNGVLIRSFSKDDASTTYIDWDLKNRYLTPISSGLYVIHVKVDGVGERIIKWFGMMRPIDLDSF